MEHVPAAGVSTGAADVIRMETANDGDEGYGREMMESLKMVAVLHRTSLR